MTILSVSFMHIYVVFQIVIIGILFDFKENKTMS